jgi:hypothetical protein
MTGDCHVRFCESLRRKPWATRPSSSEFYSLLIIPNNMLAIVFIANIVFIIHIQHMYNKYNALPY